MPRGDKSSYSGKQKRQAEHIEEGHQYRGVGRKEAERRAWATANKETARRQGFRRPSGRDTQAKRHGAAGARKAAPKR